MAFSPDINNLIGLRPLQTLPSFLVLAILIYFGSHIIYNLYISPLRHIPGPKLWAISKIPNAVVQCSGDSHKTILKLHQQYGDIVRISPNHVSFLRADAWKGVMGFQKGKGVENQKEPIFIAPMAKGLIGAHTESHRRQRRVVAPGFSSQSLVDQESLIRTYVDLLVTNLKQRSQGGTVPLNVVEWYNWTTFDIIGDLLFGESFGCLANGKYHPWVAMVFGVVKQSTILTQITYVWPGIQFWLRVFAGKKMDEKIEDYQGLVKQKVSQRIEMGTQRPDLMDAMLRGGATEGEKLSLEEIQINSGNFIMAGSETTATTLSAATFLLCTHPEVLRQLTEEIRSAFASEEEITFRSVQKLKYMPAVLNETMRLLPAVPGETPRIVPPGGDVICDKFIPGGTILGIFQWALYHDPKNFTRPDEFLPDRWLNPSLFPNDNMNAFRPFSYGPRDCIGQNLALVEMRIILAMVIWNFDLKLDDSCRDWMDQLKGFTIYQKGPVGVYMIPRKDVSHS